jgi:hypothetical protein
MATSSVVTLTNEVGVGDLPNTVMSYHASQCSGKNTNLASFAASQASPAIMASKRDIRYDAGSTGSV